VWNFIEKLNKNLMKTTKKIDGLDFVWTLFKCETILGLTQTSFHQALCSFVFLLFITQLLLPRWAGLKIEEKDTLLKAFSKKIKYNKQKCYSFYNNSDSTTYKSLLWFFFATYQVPNIAHIILKPRKSRNKTKKGEKKWNT
jgi:hypothetical protein